MDDDPIRRERVSAALKDPAQKNNRDYVDIIIALGRWGQGTVQITLMPDRKNLLKIDRDKL